MDRMTLFPSTTCVGPTARATSGGIPQFPMSVAHAAAISAPSNVAARESDALWTELMIDARGSAWTGPTTPGVPYRRKWRGVSVKDAIEAASEGRPTEARASDNPL